jgi:hypothetical protein
VAGALASGLAPGTIVTVSKVVDGEGRVLWEGDPLAVSEAQLIVLCDAGRVVDEPSERAGVAARTGAHAVDMESAALAESGRLIGVVRAIVDTPEERVGRLAFAANADGSTDWAAVARAFASEPLTSIRVAARARKAFAALERAAQDLARLPAAGSST